MMHTVARSDNAFVLTVLAQTADALPVCFPRPPPCRSIVKGLEFFSPVRRFCSHLPITKKTAESTVFSELHFTLERSLHEIVIVIFFCSRLLYSTGFTPLSADYCLLESVYKVCPMDRVHLRKRSCRLSLCNPTTRPSTLHRIRSRGHLCI